MIGGLLVLLLCQLAGELISRTLDLPVPGPVVGMLILLALLSWCGEDRLRDVTRSADALLDQMPMLFVPAGVGVLGYVAVIRAQWLPVVGGMFIGWAAGLLATAWAATLVLRITQRRLE